MQVSSTNPGGIACSKECPRFLLKFYVNSSIFTIFRYIKHYRIQSTSLYSNLLSVTGRYGKFLFLFDYTFARTRLQRQIQYLFEYNTKLKFCQESKKKFQLPIIIGEK
jgi:hypothetical protein